MQFDVINFIPSLDVREECQRVGKTFNTHEKAAIVSRSHKPMKDRLDAYLAIGEEDDEYHKTLKPITDWMHSKLESFTTTVDGYVFFSNRRGFFHGYLDSWVSSTFEPVFDRCKGLIEDSEFMITKAAIDQEFYETAFFDANGSIIHICEFSQKHLKGYDPEKQLNAYNPEIPCPFRKGDLVCYHFEPETPMIFIEQQVQMRFKHIGEDYETGRLFTCSGILCNQLSYYKKELPQGELLIAQKAVLGKLDFISALNLIWKCRLEKEMNELDDFHGMDIS